MTDGYNDPQFEAAISGFNTAAYQPPAHTPEQVTPYGANPHIHPDSIPAKPGLTRRGRTALAIGAVVLAGGGLITWQHHADTAAANELKAKQLQLQQDQLNLAKEQAAAKANQSAAAAQAKANTARQKHIDDCVEQNKGLVGKQLGATYRSVVEDCQAQYPDTTTSTDTHMQETASAQSAGGGINAGEGLLIGGGILITGLVVAARRATRPQTQNAPHPTGGSYVYYPPN